MSNLSHRDCFEIIDRDAFFNHMILKTHALNMPPLKFKTMYRNIKYILYCKHFADLFEERISPYFVYKNDYYPVDGDLNLIIAETVKMPYSFYFKPHMLNIHHNTIKYLKKLKTILPIEESSPSVYSKMVLLK